MARKNQSDEAEEKNDRRSDAEKKRLKELEWLFGRRLHTVAFVAEKLGLSQQTVIDEIKRPNSKLPALSTGRIYLIDERHIWQYLGIEPKGLPEPPALEPLTDFENAQLTFVALEDIMLYMHIGRPRLMQDIEAGKLVVVRSSSDKGEIRILLQKALEYINSFWYKREEETPSDS